MTNGPIHRQTLVGACSRLVFASLHDRKTPITAAGLPNDRVVAVLDARGAKPRRVPAGRGTEHRGNAERHEFEPCLAIEDTGRSRTGTKSRPTNGIVERFHKTAPEEFRRVVFGKGDPPVRGRPAGRSG